MEKDLAEKTFPSTLGCFEKIAVTNNTPEGWFYGKDVRHLQSLSLFAFDHVHSIVKLCVYLHKY